MYDRDELVTTYLDIICRGKKTGHRAFEALCVQDQHKIHKQNLPWCGQAEKQHTPNLWQCDTENDVVVAGW